MDEKQGSGGERSSPYQRHCVSLPYSPLLPPTFLLLLLFFFFFFFVSFLFLLRRLGLFDLASAPRCQSRLTATGVQVTEFFFFLFFYRVSAFGACWPRRKIMETPGERRSMRPLCFVSICTTLSSSPSPPPSSSFSSISPRHYHSAPLPRFRPARGPSPCYRVFTEFFFFGKVFPYLLLCSIRSGMRRMGWVGRGGGIIDPPDGGR